MKILIEVIIIGSLAIRKNRALQRSSNVMQVHCGCYRDIISSNSNKYSVIIFALCISGVVFLRTSLKIFGDEQIISNGPSRPGILAAIRAHDLVSQQFLHKKTVTLDRQSISS